MNEFIVQTSGPTLDGDGVSHNSANDHWIGDGVGDVNGGLDAPSRRDHAASVTKTKTTPFNKTSSVSFMCQSLVAKRKKKGKKQYLFKK